MHVQLHIFGIIALSSLISSFAINKDNAEKAVRERNSALEEATNVSSVTLPNGIVFTTGTLSPEAQARPNGPVSPNPARRAALAQYINIYCGCGFNLNHAQTDAVAAAMNNQLTNLSIQPGASYMWSLGNTVAFTCHFAGGVTVLAQNQYLIAVRQQVSPVCGAYIAGTWESIQYSGDDVTLGYMRYNGESIGTVCNAARGSGARTQIVGVGSLPYIC